MSSKTHYVCAMAAGVLTFMGSSLMAQQPHQTSRPPHCPPCTFESLMAGHGGAGGPGQGAFIVIPLGAAGGAPCGPVSTGGEQQTKFQPHTETSMIQPHEAVSTPHGQGHHPQQHREVVMAEHETAQHPTGIAEETILHAPLQVNTTETSHPAHTSGAATIGSPASPAEEAHLKTGKIQLHAHSGTGEKKWAKLMEEGNIQKWFVKKGNNYVLWDESAKGQRGTPVKKVEVGPRLYTTESQIATARGAATHNIPAPGARGTPEANIPRSERVLSTQSKGPSGN
jgi:hypothetical protein